MPVKRRSGRQRVADYDPAVWAFLYDEPFPPGTSPARQWLIGSLTQPVDLGLPGAHPSIRDCWATVGPDVLADWIETKPGTRPSCWWRWDAPRDPAGAPPGYLAIDIPPAPHLPAGAGLVESEAAYLRRFDLLLPGELALLRAGDFRPVAASAV